MNFRSRILSGTILGLAFAGFGSLPASAEGTVNVYSYRQPPLIEPLLTRFTDETGIKVQMIFAEQGLIERMVQEGTGSPADLLLTADVQHLVEAAQKDLVQPVVSAKITGAVPAPLRDPDNKWFGLTMRSRVVFASNDRVKVDRIAYEELSDPKWKGRICMRSGQHVYNLGLFAAMLAHHGHERTKAWLEGLKANLVRKPSGNDRSQAKSVWAGECDLAITNTYYVGKMATNDTEPEQKQWAASGRVIFPTFEGEGSHVNISGMALAKNAPNRDNALKLMEFLASDEAQKVYADGNYEYPVNPAVKPDPLVVSWGTLNPDPLPIGELTKLQPEASKLVDEVGFDQ